MVSRNKLFYMCSIMLLQFGLACSSSNPNPANPGLSLNQDYLWEQRIITANHHLWSYSPIIFDPVTNTANVLPAREANLHLNILPFIEPPTGVNLSVSNISLSDQGKVLDCDISITHPFPTSMKRYTGFDVRGILISSGSLTGYNDYKVRIAGPMDIRLMNPDGHTKWWNPVEFTKPGPSGYVDGLMGVPDATGHYDATLNGYKYFADDLDPDEDITNLEFATRGIFSAGATNTRHYKIYFPNGPSQMVFNYAVDASWAMPTIMPPDDPVNDFPASANMIEPFAINVVETGNTLYFEDALNNGGAVEYEITAYTWQGPDSISRLAIESPGLIPYTYQTLPESTNEYSATYRFKVNPTVMPEWGFDILVSAFTGLATYKDILDPDALVALSALGAYRIHATDIAINSPFPQQLPFDDHLTFTSAPFWSIEDNDYVTIGWEHDGYSIWNSGQTPESEYIDNIDCTLVSPQLIVPQSGHICLSLSHRYQTEKNFDICAVTYRINNSNWVTSKIRSGENAAYPDWATHNFLITGLTPDDSIEFGFNFSSDEIHHAFTGWDIDRVRAFEIDLFTQGPTEDFEDPLGLEWAFEDLSEFSTGEFWQLSTVMDDTGVLDAGAPDSCYGNDYYEAAVWTVTIPDSSLASLGLMHMILSEPGFDGAFLLVDGNPIYVEDYLQGTFNFNSINYTYTGSFDAWMGENPAGYLLGFDTAIFDISKYADGTEHEISFVFESDETDSCQDDAGYGSWLIDEVVILSQD